MRAREGDFIEDLCGLILDVKGLIHPPDRIVAFPRFVPNLAGERKRANISYNKVYALSERFALLKEKFPQYLVYDPIFNEHLCEVPVKTVKNHYQPADRLRELRYGDRLDEVERQALRFVELLKENANVSWSKLGISGSILVRLHTKASDIDPIVYESESCYKVYSALRRMLLDRKNPLKPYSLKELKRLFDFRSKDTLTHFEDFVRTDSRKVLQGKFMERDYFLRFVKDWNEIEEQYGKTRYTSQGYAKISAAIVDASEAIFTPCRYKIGDVKILKGNVGNQIKEIVSFRGRFCEQARKGETVIAQGKVEKVQKENKSEHFRLLLGNKISDYMILA
ncbi:MAG: hypothetical protein ACE5IF_03280 [Candidatus Bathyarchaeia archaeon]